MLQTLYDYFWWERLWLPVNLTWADLEDRDGRVYAKASDLYITLPLALLFLIVRYFFELYVATPLAALLNIKEKTRLRAPPNATLEHFYLTSGKQPKQSGLSGRQVERWFRRRRNQDRPSLLKKFREASWRFTFYLIAFIAGMAVIVDKPWFYDMKKVWEGYPIQSTIPSQYWYYMIELSFYWSLLFSIASDVKRKDFKEQIIHHVATIILISFSWFANYIRAGTLIMALHDSSDYLLESAKMFNYAGWKNTCNNIFIIFAIVFIITRLVILPFWILHCTLVYPLELYPAFFGYYFFNSMMGVLQLLHIFWAYLILRMAHKFITGKVKALWGGVARPETSGQGSTIRKTQFLRKRQFKKGWEEGCPLKKTSSAFNGPTATEQLLAFHTAHLVVVVPSKFCPSPDSSEEEEKGWCVAKTADNPGPWGY
uniref:Ceramide synthase 2 n=1 Tax=Mandrillus leucophaeus TaxID=9568 RepID=A0A2K5ZI74_MANLE